MIRKELKLYIGIKSTELKLLYILLTRGPALSSVIRAPPEAKLTPVCREARFLLDSRERYGGEVGKPTFSAACDQ